MFAAIGAILTLYLSLIAEFYYRQASSWPDFLSGQQIDVYISQWLPDTENQVTVKNLTDFCKERDESLLIYRNVEFTGGKEVYLSGNTSFKPDIVEGRNFAEEDFENQKQVAIIADDEDMIETCIIRNGKEYILHENNEYEVIGKFNRPSVEYLQRGAIPAGYYIYDASYFVNMAASFDIDPDVPLYGDYTIDAKGKSTEFLNDFKTVAREINPDITVDVKKLELAVPVDNSQRLLRVLRAINYQDSVQVAYICFITCFLLLLNFGAITNYWVSGRTEEIAGRVNSGGKLTSIRNIMLRDYLILVTLGYLAGLLLLIILLHIKPFSLILTGITIYPIAIIISYLICLLIGLIFGYISLTIILRKNTQFQLVTSNRGE